MNQQELSQVLASHVIWIQSGEGEKANLREANLRGANLRGADLYKADLHGANLYKADLRGANLRGANLREANLYKADLHGADLRGANLYKADLHGANLYKADLRGANLRGADLREANLYKADLHGADLREACLYALSVDKIMFLSCSNYPYKIAVILTQDGIRYVKMGCLLKTLEEWERIGILNSNLSEFPNDGSEKSVERAAMFEFAKSAALRMRPTPIEERTGGK